MFHVKHPCTWIVGKNNVSHMRKKASVRYSGYYTKKYGNVPRETSMHMGSRKCYETNEKKLL